MDDQLPHIADSLNLPNSLLLPVAFGLSTYSALRMLAEQFGPVAKALGPLGRRWTALREQRIAKAANVADLTAQVDKLTAAMEVLERDNAWLRKMRDEDAWTTDLNRQVRELSAIVRRLRDRQEVIDAYILEDTEWHRHTELAWGDSDREARAEFTPPTRVPFLEFERRWHAERRYEDG